MKTRTLLIDSSYLLKRSLNGGKNVYTPKFGHIGGLYFFYTTLRKLIKEHAINKVVLVWDGENGGKFRYLLDPKYKSNRENKEWSKKIELTTQEIEFEKNKEVSVLKQRKRIQAYAEELFFRQIEADEVEADDLIAAYTISYNQNEDIFLYTKDRDFAQLIDYNITILFDDISMPVTKGNFFMYFPYHYKNALPIKILCGDNSDNIDGIPSVGIKTLLKYFPEIETKPITVREICQKAKLINDERILNKKKPILAMTNISEGLERIKLNYQLINLNNPLLTNDAKEMLEQLSMPLSPEGRSLSNLFKMMLQDDFLNHYSGNFTDYVSPFSVVGSREKEIYNNFIKNNQKLL